ncbi:hypothetical protein [Vibrio chagasii]|uniref:hypothetical protein n=1 Tax=Vibrio chagasii TaxID=170679 RepID=UPI003736C5B4
MKKPEILSMGVHVLQTRYGFTNLSSKTFPEAMRKAKQLAIIDGVQASVESYEHEESSAVGYSSEGEQVGGDLWYETRYRVVTKAIKEYEAYQIEEYNAKYEEERSKHISNCTAPDCESCFWYNLPDHTSK